MQNFDQEGSTVDQVWKALKRRRWLALLLFAGALAVGASVIVALPDYYTASATVMINQGDVPQAYVRSPVEEELEPRLYAVTQAVTSQRNLMQVIEEENLYPEARATATEHALVERMRRDITIERERVELAWGRGATIAFMVSFQGFDRGVVARVTNRLAEMYVTENNAIRERQASETTEFLKSQLDAAKARLDEQERAVNAYRESRLGELPEQQSANLATLSRLNAQLRLNSASQLRAMERRGELARQLDDEGFATASGRSARLSRLRSELADLRTRYSDRHPDVIRLQAEIENFNDNEPLGGSYRAPTLLERQIEQVDEEIAALRREEQRLHDATEVYEQRIENTPRREQELAALTRDYTSTRDQYTQLLTSYEDALLAESLERRNSQQFRVVDHAVAPDSPAGPPRLRLLLMTLVLSTLLAGAGVVVAEQLDSSFHSIDELKDFTAVPVVAGIPRIITLGDVVRGWVRIGVSATAAAVLVAGLAVGGFLVGSDNTALVSMISGGKAS